MKRPSNTCIIYKIINIISGSMYIGQTWDPLQYRFDAHKRSSDKCKALNDAMKSYGRDNFKIELITVTSTQECADYWEMYFIKKYDTIRTGYNLTEGGLGGKKSEETKRRMRKPKSEEHKRKLTIAAKTRGLREIGKKLSEETKKKCSESSFRKGKPMPEDNKRKLIAANTGRKHSEETKRKISESHKKYRALKELETDNGQK